MPPRLTIVGDLERPDLYHLPEDACCYFWGEYTPYEHTNGKNGVSQPLTNRSPNGIRRITGLPLDIRDCLSFSGKYAADAALVVWRPMLTTAVRSDREELSGAHWESWMRLAGETTFNLIGGTGARPERTIADDALALAQGTSNRLGRTLANAIATQSVVGWPDVLRFGFAPVRKVLLSDLLCREYVLVDDARSRRYIYTAMAAAFCDLVKGKRPRYKMGARVAHMRCTRYQTVYDIVRGHLQCTADEAASSAWRIR